MNMKTQYEKRNEAIENAIMLRNEILWKGLTNDDELSEKLQLAFQDVSLAILELVKATEGERNTAEYKL